MSEVWWNFLSCGAIRMHEASCDVGQAAPGPVESLEGQLTVQHLQLSLTGLSSDMQTWSLQESVSQLQHASAATSRQQHVDEADWQLTPRQLRIGRLTWGHGFLMLSSFLLLWLVAGWRQPKQQAVTTGWQMRASLSVLQPFGRGARAGCIPDYYLYSLVICEVNKI